MCTAAQPLTSATPQYPHGQYDKELRDKVLAYKGLRGIRNYDITDPTKPNLLQEYNTGEKGNGTHHNFYDGGKYAYLDCGWDETLRLENHQRPYSNALMIVDMSDPANVQEVSTLVGPRTKTWARKKNTRNIASPETIPPGPEITARSPCPSASKTAARSATADSAHSAFTPWICPT